MDASPPPILVLMPTRGTVAAETFAALMDNVETGRPLLLTENRLPVDVARNRLAERALAPARDADPIVFWIDSDAFFLRGTFTLLIRALERSRFDVVAPMSGARTAGSSIQALRDAADFTSSPRPGIDCTAGEIVPVQLVSTHFVVHRRSLLERLGPRPFGEADNLSETDDFHFCRQVREIGGTLGLHTGVPVFHVDERTGAAFLPGFDAVAVNGNDIDAAAKPQTLPLEKRSYGARIDRIYARNDSASARSSANR